MEDNEKNVVNNEEAVEVVFAELDKLADKPNKRQLYLGALAGIVGIATAAAIVVLHREKKESKEE